MEKQNKLNNKGYSLVMVLIAIGFVGMLVAAILYMSYINLTIRNANLKNKESFYTAESALEEVKAGLEKEASDAFGSAYLTIIQNYELYSDQKRMDQFRYEYVEGLKDLLKYPAGVGYYDVERLNSYLQKTAWNDDKNYGAVVMAGDSREYGTMVVRTDGVLLRDVTVTYKSKNNNVSVIKTDILVKVPAISFKDSVKMPDFLDFIIIANDEIDVDFGSTVLTGSMYAGPGGINVERTATDLRGIQTLITDGTFNINGTAVELRDSSLLWAKNVTVESCSAALRGTQYIQDDLTINGSGSNVLLGNNYYGYGTGGDATGDNNSAIIVNGLRTTLDMSEIKNMYLAGRSFIKTAGSVNMGGTTYTNADVLMGESLGIKSNQLAYLVPEECLFVKEGKSLSKSNPVLFDNIQGYLNEGAVEYDSTAISKKLKAPIGNYASGCVKVYSNTNNVRVVYYYLTFATEEKANAFFKDFYAADSERLNKYIKVYLTDLRLPEEDVLKLDLAGNAFTKENGEYRLVESTIGDDNNTSLNLDSLEYERIFKQLCTTLTRTEPTSKQLQEKEANGIFYNIVDRAFLNKLVPFVGNVFVGYDSNGQNGIVVVNNATTPYRISLSTTHGEDWNKVKLLVATGDVIVDRSFRGIVISNGVITVTGTAILDPDPEGVSAAMQVVTRIDDKEYMLVNLFSDGNYAFSEEEEEEGPENIKVSDLIVYENWREE